MALLHATPQPMRQNPHGRTQVSREGSQGLHSLGTSLSLIPYSDYFKSQFLNELLDPWAPVQKTKPALGGWGQASGGGEPGGCRRSCLHLSARGAGQPVTAGHRATQWAADHQPQSRGAWLLSVLFSSSATPTPAAAGSSGELDSLCSSPGPSQPSQDPAETCLLQVLGMLATLGLGFVTLTYLLWQVPLPHAWHQMHPEEASPESWEALEGEAGQQRDSCR